MIGDDVGGMAVHTGARMAAIGRGVGVEHAVPIPRAIRFRGGTAKRPMPREAILVNEPCGRAAGRLLGLLPAEVVEAPTAQRQGAPRRVPGRA
jgi:hypothetical protein